MNTKGVLDHMERHPEQVTLAIAKIAPHYHHKPRHVRLYGSWSSGEAIRLAEYILGIRSRDFDYWALVEWLGVHYPFGKAAA